MDRVLVAKNVNIMSTVYLNMKTSAGVETVDEFNSDTSLFTPASGAIIPPSTKEFRQYISKMVAEYHLAGINVYRSSRCTKDWSNKG